MSKTVCNHAELDSVHSVLKINIVVIVAIVVSQVQSKINPSAWFNDKFKGGIQLVAGFCCDILSRVDVIFHDVSVTPAEFLCKSYL